MARVRGEGGERRKRKEMNCSFFFVKGRGGTVREKEMLCKGREMVGKWILILRNCGYVQKKRDEETISL